MREGHHIVSPHISAVLSCNSFLDDTTEYSGSVANLEGSLKSCVSTVCNAIKEHTPRRTHHAFSQSVAAVTLGGAEAGTSQTERDLAASISSAVLVISGV